MVPSANQAWNLESFLDSLIVELDKAQDTLSFKGITRRLTYTVKDVGLDLQIFPQYDGRKVRFVTAQPGDAGASKISIQLGSISDRQIKETTKEPPSKDDVSLDDVEGIDTDTKESLRRVGITSAGDLERIENRNVDVEKVVREKVSDEDGAKPAVDYANLARLIKKARRTRQLAPRVFSVDLEQEDGGRVLSLHGDNLVLSRDTAAEGPAAAFAQAAAIDTERQFPAALLDGEPVRVLAASHHNVRLAIPGDKLDTAPAVLRVALDPYAVITMEIKP
jgi:hypothetical protein